MKIIITALAIALGSPLFANELLPWQEKSIELARAESKVMDAMWSQSISFWVTMANDGSRRDGFGEYLCLVLNNAGRPEGEFVAISIWDAATAGTDNPSKIGKAVCN